MIEMLGLQKVVGENTMIDIPELRVASGEIAAIVGPVGSGKSQLFDLLIGKMLDVELLADCTQRE